MASPTPEPLPADDRRQLLLGLLAAHAPADDAEAADVAFIDAFVRAHPDCFGKADPEGHITASAFVLDPRGRLLMTLHRKLERWLQVGGHSDPDEVDPASTALREAQEESGLPDLVFHPAVGRRPLDIDVHRIPGRAHEPAHDHLDIRYALYTEQPEAIAITDESDALRWFELDAVEELGVDDAVRRVLGKLRRLQTVKTAQPPPAAGSTRP